MNDYIHIKYVQNPEGQMLPCGRPFANVTLSESGLLITVFRHTRVRLTFVADIIVEVVD